MKDTAQMSVEKYATFKPVRPYFDLVRGALDDLVDGEHFFDCVSEKIVYEARYEFPGWPRIIEGRADLMEAFRGYGKHIELAGSSVAATVVTHCIHSERLVARIGALTGQRPDTRDAFGATGQVESFSGKTRRPTKPSLSS